MICGVTAVSPLYLTPQGAKPVLSGCIFVGNGSRSGTLMTKVTKLSLRNHSLRAVTGTYYR